jgi:hypothetical protein
MLIVASLLSVIAVSGFTVIRASVLSSAIAQSKAQSLEEVRDVMKSLISELQQARKNDPFAGPTSQRTRVLHRGDPAVALPLGVDTEIVFQKPLTGPGDGFSGDVRFRYLSEDDNQNGLLDPGEDAIVPDGVLTRRVERIEGAGEEEARRIVGGANNISSLAVALDGNLLTIQIVAARPIPGRTRIDPDTHEATTDQVFSTLTGQVYLSN